MSSWKEKKQNSETTDLVQSRRVFHDFKQNWVGNIILSGLDPKSAS